MTWPPGEIDDRSDVQRQFVHSSDGIDSYDDSPPPANRQAPRRWLAMAGAFLLVVASGAVGWLLTRPAQDDPATAVWVDATGTMVSTTGAPPSTPAVTATPSPSRKPTTPAKAKPQPRPTPTRKPPAAELPPAPPAQPTPESTSCIKHPGPDAPREEVRQALVAAGAREHWQGTQLPADLEGPLPTITVPANLMKAVAWQESGWQSTIIACDGGIGTMQVMPGTATFVNNRFGMNEDVHTLSGNTALGAAYLQWLTMYFGLYYFGAFDLTATAPVGDGGATMLLRDVVIAAYNVGPVAVENDNGTPDDGSDDTLSIPNQRYVNNVTALITECECLAF